MAQSRSKKREKKSSATQGVSIRQSGKDAIVELLEENSIPVTLTNYLEAAYPDLKLDYLPAELAADLPEFLQGKG